MCDIKSKMGHSHCSRINAMMICDKFCHAKTFAQRKTYPLHSLMHMSIVDFSVVSPIRKAIVEKIVQ